VQQPQVKSKRVSTAVLGAGVLAALCGWIGMYSGRASTSGAARAAPSEVADASPATEADGAGSSGRRRSKFQHAFVTRPPELFVATDREAEARYRKEQARDLMQLVRDKLRFAQLVQPAELPEAIANQSLLYVEAWTDTVARLGPDMLDELAAELEADLCAADTRPAELVTIGRILAKLPELANAAGFECVFSRQPAEDIALWSLLEAWRASGLPKSAAMASIERRATDKRTLDRLNPPDADQLRALEANAMQP
jgi:hypothetical protein